MKILYVTTIGLTMTFFKDLVKELIDKGNTVDIACNEDIRPVEQCYHEWGCIVHQIDCTRSPFNTGNIKAVKQLRKIAVDGRYDIVHCHTPIAGACTRLAMRPLRKNGLEVIYTAHGFHFYKGAPFLNWLIYYPVEKICAHFTDALFTINHEDYDFAKKKIKVKQIEYVPGVGVDIDKFKNIVVDKSAKRKELGIPEDAYLMLSVGELNENKNHQLVIRALAEINDSGVHYAVAGVGPLKEYLLNLAKELGVADRVHLLGYINDIPEIYKIADLNAFPSLREGLGLAAIEGLSAGLPVVCLDNRGTREYADIKGVNVCPDFTPKSMADTISRVISDKKQFLQDDFGSIERFSIKTVNKKCLVYTIFDKSSSVCESVIECG